jgi:hypothetical protein
MNKKEIEHFNKSFMNINYIKNLLETDKINNKIKKIKRMFYNFIGVIILLRIHDEIYQDIKHSIRMTEKLNKR